MNNVKQAQPVEYRGCRFRSHEDARWAVFFNAIEAPWEYMTKELPLPGGSYRPRFWLPLTGHSRDCFPEGGRWFDYGDAPHDEDVKIMAEAASVTGHHYLWGIGSAGEPNRMARVAQACRAYDQFLRQLHGPTCAEPILGARLPERAHLKLSGEFTGPFASVVTRCPLAPQLSLLVQTDRSKYSEPEDEFAEIARRLYRAHWLARTATFQ